jgi:competence protein ComEC
VVAVDPDYVVFSAGYRNRFGFPAPQVQARYRQIGARLISTSESGAITFRLPASGPMKPPELYRVLSHRYWHAPSLDFRS